MTVWHCFSSRTKISRSFFKWWNLPCQILWPLHHSVVFQASLYLHLFFPLCCCQVFFLNSAQFEPRRRKKERDRERERNSLLFQSRKILLSHMKEIRRLDCWWSDKSCGWRDVNKSSSWWYRSIAEWSLIFCIVSIWGLRRLQQSRSDLLRWISVSFLVSFLYLRSFLSDPPPSISSSAPSPNRLSFFLCWLKGLVV